MCGDGKEAYRIINAILMDKTTNSVLHISPEPVQKEPPNYTLYLAIGLAFLVGIFVGAILLPSVINPPTRLMVQCINNTSSLLETTKLIRGIAP